MATMASVINIVAISVNRYWSIAYPISYRKYVRKHFVYLVMTIIWVISFRKSFVSLDEPVPSHGVCSVNFAPGIWLFDVFGSRDDGEELSVVECSGDYNRSFVYMLIAQFNYFIWPFVVLCLLNLLIMLNIWKRTRRMTRLKSSIETKFVRAEERTIEGDLDDQQGASILNENKVPPNAGCQTIVVDRLAQRRHFQQIFSFAHGDNALLHVNSKAHSSKSTHR